MPGSAESGLLVVRLPLRTASEQIRDKLSSLEPAPALPRTASDIFSLANLGNLSRDRFDPPATDSAVQFLCDLAPDPRHAITEPPVLPPPTELLPPDRRRLRPLHVLLGLALAATSFGVTLAFVRPTRAPSATVAIAAEQEPPGVSDPVPTPAALPAETTDAPAPPAPATFDDRRQLLRVMDRLRFRVKRCFARHHRRGRVRVRVTVLATGELRSARVRSRAGRAVVACVRRQVRRAWFPPVGVPAMTVSRNYAR